MPGTKAATSRPRKTTAVRAYRAVVLLERWMADIWQLQLVGSAVSREQAVEDQGAHQLVIVGVLRPAEQPRQRRLAVHGERFGDGEMEQVPRDVSQRPLVYEPVEDRPRRIVERTHQRVEVGQPRRVAAGFVVDDTAEVGAACGGLVECPDAGGKPG